MNKKNKNIFQLFIIIFLIMSSLSISNIFASNTNFEISWT